MERQRLPMMMAVGFALTLAGCTVGPDYVQPETQTPDTWHTTAVEGLEDGEANLQTWWTVFDDRAAQRAGASIGRRQFDPARGDVEG